MKNIRIFIWKLSVFGGEIFNIYLNRRVFVMFCKAVKRRPVLRYKIYPLRLLCSHFTYENRVPIKVFQARKRRGTGMVLQFLIILLKRFNKTKSSVFYMLFCISKESLQIILPYKTNAFCIGAVKPSLLYSYVWVLCIQGICFFWVFFFSPEFICFKINDVKQEGS